MKNNVQRQVLRAALSKPLAKKCAIIAALLERIARKLLRTREDVAIARYEIGEQVASVMDDETRYGTSGVQQLAQALGCTAANLYTYAVVIRAWPKTRLTSLMTEHVFLSFSHFIALAEEPAVVRREAVLVEVIAQRLSVRSARERMGLRAPRASVLAADALTELQQAAYLSGVKAVVEWLRVSPALRGAGDCAAAHFIKPPMNGTAHAACSPS